MSSNAAIRESKYRDLRCSETSILLANNLILGLFLPIVLRDTQDRAGKSGLILDNHDWYDEFGHAY